MKGVLQDNMLQARSDDSQILDKGLRKDTKSMHGAYFVDL